MIKGYVQMNARIRFGSVVAASLFALSLQACSGGVGWAKNPGLSGIGGHCERVTAAGRALRHLPWCGRRHRPRPLRPRSILHVRYGSVHRLGRVLW